MSKTAIVTFQASLQGDNITEWLSPTQYTNTNSPYVHFQSNVTTGTTTILIPALPALASWLRLVPQPSNSAGISIYINAIGTNGFTIMDNEAWLPITPTINGVNSVSVVLQATANTVVDLFFY